MQSAYTERGAAEQVRWQTYLASRKTNAPASTPPAVAAAAGTDAAPAPPQKTIEFTVVTSNNVLTKTCTIDPAGRVAKKAAKPLFAGQANRHTISGEPSEILRRFGGVLANLTSKQAIICAPPPSGRDAWELTVHSQQSPVQGTIGRTQENFPPICGPALFGMDFDTTEFPDEAHLAAETTTIFD